MALRDSGSAVHGDALGPAETVAEVVRSPDDGALAVGRHGGMHWPALEATLG